MRRAHSAGKYVVLDCDWYGFSNFSLAETVAASEELSRRVHVQGLPRSAVFRLRRAAGDIERCWKERAGHVSATYAGLNLWEVCRTSIAKELGRQPPLVLGPEERRVADQFFHWAVLCINGMERTLDELQPDAVLVFQGGVFDSRCVVESAARRGIRTIAVETSFIGNMALVDSLSGIIVNRHTLAARGSTLCEARFHDIALDPVAFWQKSLCDKGDHHRTGGASPDSLRLPADRKVLLVIGQVAADASITLDSPLYRSSAYLIAHTVDIAERQPDWHVVARLHPKEAWHLDRRNDPDAPGEYLWDNTLRELRALHLDKHPNLTIVSGPEMSTYELMQRACVGVTINSQAGLEMALLGKPVVTTGRCFYAQNGFTWDVGRRELLEPALVAAMDGGITPGETARLHAFCRYLFGHYLLPIDPQHAARKVHRIAEVLGVAGLGQEGVVESRSAVGGENTPDKLTEP